MYLVLVSINCRAQTLSCPSPNIYLLNGTAIQVYNTSQPASSSNPSSTGISLPTGGNGLALMPNINGGTLTPTFYTTVSGTYYYWNGSSWISTGHSTGSAAAVNIGGCGSILYNYVGLGSSVYTYSGTSTGSLLISLSSESGAVFDIVPDCNCNFYIFNGTHQTLNKYSPSGTLLTTYTLSMPTSVSGGAGYAIVGNEVYFSSGSTIYKGNIGAGSTITFTSVGTSLLAGSASDWASCPVDINVIPVTETISVGASLCQTASIAATTTTSVLYSWSGPGITSATNIAVINVNAPGIYTCTVLSSGCGAVPGLTLTPAYGTNTCITVASTSITCANLGSATVSIPGGGSYSYTWMPSAQAGSVATGLSPGTYTLTVYNNTNASTYTTTTTFNSLIPLTGNISHSNMLDCNGASNGTAAVTNISGGSGNQTYLWSNGVNSYTVDNPLNLTSGLWSITMTDALTGCQINQQFFINQPSAVVASPSANTPSVCLGGSITLTGNASGGTPSLSQGYTYSWTAGLSGSTQTVSNNLAGNYTYTLNAVDSLGCSGSHTIAVSFVSHPALTVSSTSICPLHAGTLIAGGAASYSWNTGATGSTFTDAPVASQQYTVTGEALGCSSTATAGITLLPVPVPLLNNNSPLCQNDALVVSASGGVAYSWSGPNAFISSLQSVTLYPVPVNANGVYNVTVTAANSCTAGASQTVAINPLPVLTISPGSPSICASTTSVILTANGTATLFSWQPGLGLSAVNTATVNAYPPATQVYTLTGSLNGCTATAQATVNVVPPPMPAISLSSGSTCAQFFNGSPNTITLTSSGASTYTISTPNDIYNSNPGGPITNLNTLPPHVPGVSTATLYGSNGVCTMSATAQFTIIPNPTVSVSNPTPVICAGDSFTYTSAGALSYVWGSATPGQTLYTTGNVAVTSPTTSAVFSVYGGSLGCNSPLQSSTITVNPLPIVSVEPNIAVICLNSSVTLIAGGTGVSYSWQPPYWLNTDQGATVIASPLVLQNYTVIASLNSCTASALATVSVLPLPGLQITSSQAIMCLDQSFTLHAQGAASYSWYFPNQVVHSGQGITIVPVDVSYSGNYTLTGTDDNGCSNTATVFIKVEDRPSGYLQSNALQGCVPLCGDYQFVASNYAQSDVTITSWQINNETLPAQASFHHCFTDPGDYFIKVNLITTQGCANTVTLSINAYPKPVADFIYTPEKPVENMDVVNFTPPQDETLTEFNWYFADNAHQSAAINPQYLFETAGEYPVALVLKNQWGCVDSVVKALAVDPDFAVYVPEAFTPNDDGRNDVFYPVTRGAHLFSLMIFDRWGEKLFSSADPSLGWDGTYKKQPCKEDVYVWKLEATGVNHETKKLSGFVTLLR